MTLQLDAEAGARVLFDRTFNGTLFSTWDEQPAAFKDTFRETAVAVASATVVERPDPLLYEEHGAT